MAKKIFKISLERFASLINKKDLHNGNKIRFNWTRRKGGH